MRIFTNLYKINLIQNNDNQWWINEDYMERIINILEKKGLLSYFNYLEVEKYTKIKTKEDILNIISSLSNDTVYLLLLKEKRGENNTEIAFRISRNIIEMQINIEEKYISNSVISNIKTLIIDLYKEFQEIALLGDEMSISLKDFVFPKICPPRHHKYLRSKVLTDFISKKYFDENPQKKDLNQDYLYNSSLPNGATREIINDDLYIINWCDDPLNKDKLKQSLMNREEWMYKNLEMEIDSDFTVEGYEKVTYDYANDDFFDMYHNMEKAVYKFAELNEKGEIDEEVKEKIKEYNESKTLQNGDPFEYIVLCFPQKEEAIKIRKQAKELGIYSTAYRFKRKFWILDPIGNWRTDILNVNNI